MKPLDPSPSSARSLSGVVVIGRNEGERLRACLESLQGQPWLVVYVDSGSSDGSVEVAKDRCSKVVELDPASPMSAARARNEGAATLTALEPGLAFVQFLDGDCTMQPGWLDAAESALVADSNCAVVIGQLDERHPNASVYNRLCSLEWASQPGELQNYGSLGGIMMARLKVLEELGGFRPELIAGEDSEFGVRVGLAGHTAKKIAKPMAIHDADIHQFRQWWLRSVRAGHAIGQRAWLHAAGPMRDCARERRSALLWGLALPLAVVLTAWPTGGWSLMLLGGYAVLGFRIHRYRRRRGDSTSDSWLYTRYTLLAKFAEALGLLKFYWNKLRGRFHIIEYK